jgi:hypothetical protein
MDPGGRSRRTLMAGTLLLVIGLVLAFGPRRSTGGERGLSVYLLRSGSPDGDAAAREALESTGMEVILGPPIHLWNGTQEELGRFDAVVLLNSFNWASAGMPATGQRSLVRYAARGGGIVTGEWLLWNVFLSGYEAGLAPMLPASTASYLASGSEATYTRAEPDATMDQGLPESFSFPTNDVFGSESVLTPREGAHVFYSSTTAGGAGVVGWDYRGGRVLSFSSFISSAELIDPDYARLLANAVRWAANR